MVIQTQSAAQMPHAQATVTKLMAELYQGMQKLWLEQAKRPS